MLHNSAKTVADPCDAYDSLIQLWKKSRALCRGERFVKDYDTTVHLNNLLIPFSPSMTQDQYNFFKAEAELPGVTTQFSKTLIGGLLRKSPTIKLPDSVPDDAIKWLKHSFGRDDAPMNSFMDEALWEEIQTSRCWVFVDYPSISAKEREAMEKEELDKLKPYPILHDAENIINWRHRTNKYGKTVLDRVVVAGYSERYDDGEYEFHPELVDTRWVHELDSAGYYQVRIFKASSTTDDVQMQNGQRQIKPDQAKPVFKLDEVIPVYINDERVDEIPAWPLNGCIDPVEPILTAIVDKEVALYNKISRRNHLMYGAATYTPVISSSMNADAFEEMVAGGLGSWIHLPNSEDKADVLKTPTEALQDMEKAIAAGFEEMAKLGVRMLAPETGDQSGVALELRNAAQTAQLGSLNTKVSNTMRQVIAFMVNWRYDLEIDSADVEFELSSDFNPMPQGADWLRLATEWYSSGLIPRDCWLLILKQNDMLSPDYDDEEGQKQINEDDRIVSVREQNDNHAAELKAKMNGQKPVAKN